MKTLLGLCCLLLFSLPLNALAHPHILSLSRGEDISFSALLDELQGVHIVFVGELHDNLGHHQMQQAVIRGLQSRKKSVAIGLEMFQQDSQSQLDQWVAGKTRERTFRKIFEDNWSYWPVYRPIFLDARQQATPMVGLNIPRALVQKVAKAGVAAVPEEELGPLKGISCVVDPAYEAVLRRALGGHSGEGRSFYFFCEAQLLWDTAMAKKIVDYLQANPETIMVVLAGSTHAWKHGIPTQVARKANLSYRVLLPEVQGRLDRSSTRPEDADYLWLDFGVDGWKP
jgi:uncharacterized iron-regulated protein